MFHSIYSVNIVFVLSLLVDFSYGKTIDRCELFNELRRFRPQIDYQELNTWICIAQYQSNFSISLHNIDEAGIEYHGIFQINDLYWCSRTKQDDRLCKLSCDLLHDTYFKDDFECLYKIYSEYLRNYRNGFMAWPSYTTQCNQNNDMIKYCLKDADQKFYSTNTLIESDVKFKSSHHHQSKNISSIAKRSANSLSQQGKIYTQCDLAQELRYKHNLPKDQIHIWTCIAESLSNLNTAAESVADNEGTRNYGLFQISDKYWCSRNGIGNGCNNNCDNFKDSDIADDIGCARTIYDEHERIFGNGFHAWPVYEQSCKYRTTASILQCINDDIDNEINLPVIPNSINELNRIVKTGKVYERCELARELRYIHNLPFDKVSTWVCLAKYHSNFATSTVRFTEHGIFQINEQYWCSLDGNEKNCGISCAALGDSDITDDVKCAKKIYSEHERIFGDGFEAWSAYEPYCKHQTQFTSDCFNDSPRITTSNTFSDIKFQSTTKERKEKPKGKIYGKCELARKLFEFNIPEDQIATWVCIAKHESNFDTSAVGHLNADGSGDHGIFQISDIYWCSITDQNDKACGVPCSKFEDSDITDDVECIKKIFDEHQRLFGNGFQAWAVYNPYCKRKTYSYIAECFIDNQNTIDNLKLSPGNAIIDYGRAYERCELAKELHFQHNIPKDEIADWVCIALYSSNLATSSKGLNKHGLFQISDEWCSNDGSNGKGCNIECSKLEDSDITDDIQCAKKIYNAHKGFAVNGFFAWNVYEPYCYRKSSNLVAGCFDDFLISNEIINNFIPNSMQSINVTKPSTPQTTNKGKIYERCELARELRYKHNLDNVHTWVCIAQRESNFDTSIVGHLNADGSGDHGLFQISDIYWCSITGQNDKACGVPCSKFEDSDISDDVNCVKKIFDEHQRLFGNGFHAWSTYEPYCKSVRESSIADCFSDAQNTISGLRYSPPNQFIQTFKQSLLTFPSTVQFSAFKRFPFTTKLTTTQKPYFASNNFFGSTTQKPAQDFFSTPFSTTQRPYFASNKFLTSTTQKPTQKFFSGPFSTTQKPYFASNNFFTSTTQKPAQDFFSTPFPATQKPYFAFNKLFTSTTQKPIKQFFSAPFSTTQKSYFTYNRFLPSTTLKPAQQFSSTSSTTFLRPNNFSTQQKAFPTDSTIPLTTKKFNIFDLYLKPYKLQEQTQNIIPQFNSNIIEPTSTTVDSKTSSIVNRTKAPSNNYQNFFLSQIAKVTSITTPNVDMNLLIIGQPTTTRTPSIYQYSTFRKPLIN